MAPRGTFPGPPYPVGDREATSLDGSSVMGGSLLHSSGTATCNPCSGPVVRLSARPRYGSWAMGALGELRRDGYVVLPQLAGAEQVAGVRRDLAPFLTGRLLGRNDFEGFRSERVYALLAKAPSVAALVEHPAVVELVGAVLHPNLSPLGQPGHQRASWRDRADAARRRRVLPYPAPP